MPLPTKKAERFFRQCERAPEQARKPCPSPDVVQVMLHDKHRPAKRGKR